MRTPLSSFASLLVLAAPAACVTQLVPESTTTVLGPNGGTATSADGLFSIIVPTGALAADAIITIETDRSSPLPEQLGATYRVLPPNLRFAVPATARRRIDGEWVGELSLGTPHGPIPGAVFDAQANHFDVLLLSLGCRERTCTDDRGCAPEGRCNRGYCTSECTSTYECERPKDCMLSADACKNERVTCTNFECVKRPPSSVSEAFASTPSTRRSEPAVTCIRDTFVLFVHTRADHCAARRCGESCVSCDSSNPSCRDQPGVCAASGECVTDVSCSAAPVADGWDASPGSGPSFILSKIAISGPRRGFDLDGRCDGPNGECVDNAASPVGIFANDYLRQVLLGGETLTLVEVAGLDAPYTGDDESVTLKFYGARDGDEPYFPANNFSIPAGERKCCEYKINPQSLTGGLAQARTRVPARIRGGRLSTLEPTDVEMVLTIGVPPHPTLRIKRASLIASLPPGLATLEDVVLGGALTPSSIAEPWLTIDDPWGLGVTMSLADFAFALPLDVDLDGDGLETVTSTEGGRIQACTDGCGPSCTIRPVDLEAPWSCVHAPELADGYSFSLSLVGTPADVIGVGL